MLVERDELTVEYRAHRKVDAELDVLRHVPAAPVARKPSHFTSWAKSPRVGLSPREHRLGQHAVGHPQ